MQTLVAPPYDVIGPEYRDELASRNQWNVVGIDLPSIPYDTVAATIADWTARGVLQRYDDPVMIAWTQEFDLPDGSHRTRKTLVAAVGADGAPSVTVTVPGELVPRALVAVTAKV